MNILVPVDFSEHSRHTLKYVLDLFKKTQSSVYCYLLNTYLIEMHTEPNQLLKSNDELKQKSKTLLEQEVKWAQNYVNNTQVTMLPISHMGRLGNVILNLLLKKTIHVVVLSQGSQEHEEIASFLRWQKYAISSVTGNEINFIQKLLHDTALNKILYIINEYEEEAGK